MPPYATETEHVESLPTAGRPDIDGPRCRARAKRNAFGGAMSELRSACWRAERRDGNER